MQKRVEFTRVSTKGQIVLPLSVRRNLKIEEGNILAVAGTKKGAIVLKKIDTEIPKEDLKTLKSLEKAWKEIEEGKYKKFKSMKAFFEYLRRH